MTSPLPNADILRRQFLSQLGVYAAAAGLAVSSRGLANEDPAAVRPTLPCIKIGTLTVSRLVAGWNPIGGYSYLGPHTDRHMKEYFTVDQTVRFLLDCEKAGINTHQFSSAETTSRRRDRSAVS